MSWQIKKEVFGKHMYEGQVIITDYTMTDANFDIKDYVLHKMTVDIAQKMVDNLTIYQEYDPEQGIHVFKTKPVFMDLIEFSKLVDEYVRRLVKDGEEDKEDTSRRDPEPLEPIIYPWFESNTDQD